MKKVGIILLIILLLIGCVKQEEAGKEPATSSTTDTQTVKMEDQLIYTDPGKTVDERVADLMSKMTLQDKAGQMVQAELKAITLKEITTYGIGSILSGGGSTPDKNTPAGWREYMASMQKSALKRELKIPVLYGYDAVHGNGNLLNATIFPHNIGLGAGNDKVLVEKMGEFVGKEMLSIGVAWNFGPCVAMAEDPRWGRTYESLSIDPNITSELAVAYFKGMDQVGALTTGKHYLGDGGTTFGTGKDGGIDRGDTMKEEQVIRDTILKPYEALVKAGVPTIMVSFSSVNSMKMHQEKYWLTDVLKNELGFTGFVISDWEGIHEIPNMSFEEQVWTSVNAGIDMLMEPYSWKETIEAIVAGVEQGKIPQARVDDAVARILQVKFESGLFEDPLLDKYKDIVSLRSDEAKQVASDLAAKSVVLLKNEGTLLPIQSGTKVYVIGEAAHNIGIQCGGWTIDWQGKEDAGKKITEGTTILEGLQALAGSKDIEIITDAAQAKDADMTLLVVSEIPYSEFQGDTVDMSLTGNLGQIDNEKYMKEAVALGKPIATVLVDGRQAEIQPYLKDWSSFAMAYLPGTEGQGVAEVLLGVKPFTGKLPMPWYTLETNDNGEKTLVEIFKMGFGIEK